MITLDIMIVTKIILQNYNLKDYKIKLLAYYIKSSKLNQKNRDQIQKVQTKVSSQFQIRQLKIQRFNLMQEINPLKRINLQQYQKPKTLIVVHYKGKRISVPLLGDCKNLTQMLYHHIDKFQQSVLKSEPKWQILSQKKIVCFASSSYSNEKTHKEISTIKKNIQKYLKYSDGDLKIDLLLSLIRIQSNSTNPILDITKYYKYMEIQPYFVQFPISLDCNPHNNSMLNKYYFYRLIEKNRIKNVYLARNLQNGYFYSVKVSRAGLAMAQHEARFLSTINHQMQQKMPCYMKNQSLSVFSPEIQSLIIPLTQIYLIPSQQQQDQQDQCNQSKYKHLAVISKYNLKGKLSDKINDKNIRITEKELLKYLKQLVWIAFTLHEEYNIIHRNLTPQSFEIDQIGDLKLTTFSSWLQCYSQQGKLNQYPSYPNSNRSQIDSSSRIYQEQFQIISDGWYNIGHYTPPEVVNKSKQGYNKHVDYYTVGVLIKQIYQKVYEYQPKDQNSTKSKLIQKMISSLTSLNIKQRQQIVLQIVQGIKKSKQQETDRKTKQISLNLNEIKLGQFLNLDNGQSTVVENQDHDLDFNGISHQQIINYFKPIKQIKESIYDENGSHYQAKKQLSKQKKKSINGSKNTRNQSSNISNSRDKSVKSMKSNKSKDKDKSRTKSKILNENAESKPKSKSKSQKKLLQSPQRNSFNNNSALTHIYGKQQKPYATDKSHVKDISHHLIDKTQNNQNLGHGQVSKKSKSKSCNKIIKNQKSPDKKSKQKKQKIHTHTVSGSNNEYNELHRTLNRTGVNIPLPKNNYKSPGRHT